MDFEPPLYNQINLFLLVLGMVLCIVPELVHGIFCLVHRNEPRLSAIPGVLPSFPTVWDRVWTLFFITLVTGFVSFSLLAKDAELTAEPTFSSILSSITAEILLYLPMVLRMIIVTWKRQDNGLGFHMISPFQLFKCGFLYVIIPPFVVAALMEQLHLPELLHEFTSTPVTQEVMETFRESDNSTLRMGIALLQQHQTARRRHHGNLDLFVLLCCHTHITRCFPPSLCLCRLPVRTLQENALAHRSHHRPRCIQQHQRLSSD